MMLGNQTFFKPTKAFIELAMSDAYCYARWLDCGAGVGHLGRRLTFAGLEVQCHDLLPRTSYEHRVEIGDCLNLHFQRDDVVVLARPSHGDWVQRVLARAATDAGRALYIGLRKNLEVDLPDMVTELVLEDAGEAGECVWRCLGMPGDVVTWHLLQTSFWHEPNWVIDGGPDKWYHNVDRMSHMGKPKCGKVLETRVAYRKGMLPQHWQPRSKEGGHDGWVTPNGAWHPCGYHEHDELIHSRFQIEVGRAEQLGFVRCRSASSLSSQPFFSTSRMEQRITPQQRRTLTRLGFTVYEDD